MATFFLVCEGSNPRPALVQAAFSQKHHALRLGPFLDLGEGSFLKDEFPDGVRELEDLGDGRPALVAREIAFGTSLRLEEVGLRVPGRIEARLRELRGAGAGGGPATRAREP